MLDILNLIPNEEYGIDWSVLRSDLESSSEKVNSVILNGISIGLSNLKIKDDFNSLIIVKSCNIEYKKSAFLEDNLIIKSFISSLSKTSFVMDQSIYRDDLLIVDAKIHLVFVNTNGKPSKIPEIVLNSFEPYILKSI